MHICTVECAPSLLRYCTDLVGPWPSFIIILPYNQSPIETKVASYIGNSRSNSNYYEASSGVDRESFAVKNFSLVAWVAKIKRTKKACERISTVKLVRWRKLNGRNFLREKKVTRKLPDLQYITTPFNLWNPTLTTLYSPAGWVFCAAGEVPSPPEALSWCSCTPGCTGISCPTSLSMPAQVKEAVTVV